MGDIWCIMLRNSQVNSPRQLAIHSLLYEVLHYSNVNININKMHFIFILTSEMHTTTAPLSCCWNQGPVHWLTLYFLSSYGIYIGACRFVFRLFLLEKERYMDDSSCKSFWGMCAHFANFSILYHKSVFLITFQFIPRVLRAMQRPTKLFSQQSHQNMTLSQLT